jgi:hypothetical protein
MMRRVADPRGSNLALVTSGAFDGCLWTTAAAPLDGQQIRGIIMEASAEQPVADAAVAVRWNFCVSAVTESVL